MLIDKISNEELNMIDEYRSMYAYSENAETQNGEFAPSYEVLKVWDKAKSEYLSNLLEGNLKLTKYIEFTKPEAIIRDELDDMLCGAYQGLGRVKYDATKFIEEFHQFIHSNTLRNLFEEHDIVFTDSEYRNYKWDLSYLTYVSALAKNEWQNDPIKIPLPNGKLYTINTGCKVMKVLNKIANAFNLKGFENFRLCHSQILNQKAIGGNLTISIHPLDYMTMSDNNCGWDSCMSWYDEGGYRQGTVEMMNSTCVIVAYLASNDDMEISHGKYWNNKKWRQLFIVDPNVILGIKAYPYQNDGLTKAVVEWLKELAGKNLGWNSYGEITAYNKHKGLKLTNERNTNLSLLTGYMYNDLGSLDEHWCVYNNDIPDDKLRYFKWTEDCEYTIPYSGKSQCMICGATNQDFMDDSCLACNECQNSKTCDCCDCSIYGDDYYFVDDMRYCPDCYNNEVAECCVCGEEHAIGNMEAIYIIPRLTEKEQKTLREDALRQDKFNCYEPFKDYPETMLQSYNNYYTLCSDCSYEDFKRLYLNPSAKAYRYKADYAEIACVYWDDLTKDAQEDLNYYPDVTDKSFTVKFASLIEKF